jgi:DNA-binding response OmpR family regulator
MRLLVVEDETRMAELLRKGFEEEGFAVATASDGSSGLAMALASDFELIILDVMMPNLNGFEVTRRLRQSGCSTPILMLTARDATPDIVTGLDLGADDYLTKPFSFEVLLARIRALLRRGAAATAPELTVGPLRLDPATRQVHWRDQPVVLTRTEFNLLEFLMRRAGQVVSRSTLIEAVWGYQRDIESNTLDVFIRQLRGKIEGEDTVRLLQTVRGVGYSIRKETTP